MQERSELALTGDPMRPSGETKARMLSNEDFQAKAHRVVGEFILAMGKTEFAMDEFSCGRL